MADVYLATDLLLEREVVVKVLLRALRDDANAVERFRREGVALATVCSPHVLGVHDIGVHASHMYLVVRYVLGRSFEELVAEQGRIPVRRAVRLVCQVLEGLRALHERRLVHRDVKPSNVLVEDGDHVVLIDLGVVQNKRHPTLTPESDTAGTPRFMAPEQRAYHVVDHRSDLYQAGLLLLYLVSGVAADDLCAEPARMESLCAGLDEPVAAVIRRALADSPVDRFLSAGEMAHALERALEEVSERQMRPALDSIDAALGASFDAPFDDHTFSMRPRRFPRSSSLYIPDPIMTSARTPLPVLLAVLAVALGVNALLLGLHW